MQKSEISKAMWHLPMFGLVTAVCRQLLLELRGSIDYGKNAKVYNNAIFDMLLRDPMNIERFMLHDYKEIRFSEHRGKVDKKTGKLKKLESCRADMIL